MKLEENPTFPVILYVTIWSLERLLSDSLLYQVIPETLSRSAHTNASPSRILKKAVFPGKKGLGENQVTGRPSDSSAEYPNAWL
ncbi:hypothetical protein ES703_108515 [subsurface metagenome]